MDENEGDLLNNEGNDSSQSTEDILSIIQEARKPVEGAQVGGSSLLGSMDLDDLEADCDIDDIETSGDFVCAM